MRRLLNTTALCLAFFLGTLTLAFLLSSSNVPAQAQVSRKQLISAEARTDFDSAQVFRATDIQIRGFTVMQWQTSPREAGPLDVEIILGESAAPLVGIPAEIQLHRGNGEYVTAGEATVRHGAISCYFNGRAPDSDYILLLKQSPASQQLIGGETIVGTLVLRIEGRQLTVPLGSTNVYNISHKGNPL